jgi:predicted metal-dependent peptidase
MVEGRMAFMDDCPFFAHYYWDQLKEYPTYDFDTAATDSRRVFFNPEYMAKLTPLERAFVLAHETDHAISNHPTRMKYYRETTILRGLPFDGQFFNVCADYSINARLITAKVGSCNPEWLYAPDVDGTELPEDVYVKKWQKPPPQQPQQPTQPGQGQGGGGQSGQGQGGSSQPPGQTYGQVKKGANPDKIAKANGGSFDQVLEPFTDPVTGAEDIPGETEFKEAIGRAAAAAKAVGKMPGVFQTMVDEILEPQVTWTEHIRMLLTGTIGRRNETWNTPNRRYLPLGAPFPGRPPMIFLPSKRGYGADLVAVAIDCSGSVSNDELRVFLSEVGGVIADCKPRRVMLIWCDARIQRIDEARSLDDLADIRVKGAPGRGGTSFHPPFAYLDEEGIVPDTMIYLTDMMGSFPEEPRYPTVWCATSDIKAPFGETVRVKV